MERRPTWIELAVAGAVVLAFVVAGAGLASHSERSSTWSTSIELPADSRALQGWSTAAESTVGPFVARLQPMIASATTVLEHAPELLLVVELGLLVEHLRLLHRVSDALPDQSDANPSTDRPPSESPQR